MRAVLCSIALLYAGGTFAGAAEHPAERGPVSRAAQAWRSTLPASWEDPTVVRLGRDSVIVAGKQEIRVLERAAGTLRWGAYEGASTFAGDDASAYFGTTDGRMSARRLSDGRLDWRSDACAGGRSVVAVAVRSTGDLVATCDDGRAALLDPASGRVRPSSPAAPKPGAAQPVGGRPSRIEDPRRFIVEAGCRAVASDRDALVVRCSPDRRSGARAKEYIALYRLHD